MGKRLYVAYGSNLSIGQMQYRCPTAKFYGTGVIEGYELQFKGQPYSAFATIAPKAGASVPVAVWTLQPQDERTLDRYEGVPNHYFKQDIPVQLHGKEITGMVYIMNQRMEFGLPSPGYLEIVREGYDDCGFDPRVLDDALLRSTQAFYLQNTYHSMQRSLYEGYDTYLHEQNEPEIEEQEEPEWGEMRL